MRAFLGCLITAALLMAAPAWGKDCDAAPGGQGRPLALTTPLSEHDRIGLSEAIRVSLMDTSGGDWPRDALKSSPKCARAEVTAGGQTYVVSGASGNLPLRWVTDRQGTVVVFLAGGLGVDQAYDVAIHPPEAGNLKVDDPTFYLVLMSPSMFHVLQVYDDIPSDAVLQADVVKALEHKLPLIADFEPSSRAVSLQLVTRSGAQARLSPPLPGQGGGAARITAPDGELFIAEPSGGIRMAEAGLVCPSAFGDYGLRDLLVANVEKASRDLACRFFADDGWFTVFVTRYGGDRPAKSVFDDYVREAKGVAKPAKEVALPLAAGLKPLPELGTAWVDQEGQEQGLWLSRVGDWYIEVRATYDPKTRDKAAAAAAHIFQAVYRDIRTPTI